MSINKDDEKKWEDNLAGLGEEGTFFTTAQANNIRALWKSFREREPRLPLPVIGLLDHYVFGMRWIHHDRTLDVKVHADALCQWSYRDYKTSDAWTGPTAASQMPERLFAYLSEFVPCEPPQAEGETVLEALERDRGDLFESYLEVMEESESTDQKNQAATALALWKSFINQEPRLLAPTAGRAGDIYQMSWKLRGYILNIDVHCDGTYDWAYGHTTTRYGKQRVSPTAQIAEILLLCLSNFVPDSPSARKVTPPMPIRRPHTYQSLAIDRIKQARVLLAEASGFLHACKRDLNEEILGEVANPPQRSGETVDVAESTLAKIAVEIANSPVGNAVT